MITHRYLLQMLHLMREPNSYWNDNSVDSDEMELLIHSGSDITIDTYQASLHCISYYETTTSYSATVTASDGSNYTTQNITVNIQNIPNDGVAYASRYSIVDSDIPNTDVCIFK